MIFGIPNSHPGFFLVLEGIDACGKSTQLRLIAKWLQESLRDGQRLLITKEPDPDSEYGRFIYQDLKKQDGINQTDPISFQTWYAKESLARMRDLIIPRLKLGDIVLSDRYRTSMVYGVRTESSREADLAELLQINWSILGENFVRPNLTIIYDIPAEMAVARMRSAGKVVDSHERLDKLQAVRRGYLLWDLDVRRSKYFNLQINNEVGSPEEVFRRSQFRLECELARFLR